MIEINNYIFNSTTDIIAIAVPVDGHLTDIPLCAHMSKLYPNTKDLYYKYRDNVRWAKSDIVLAGINTGQVVALCGVYYKHDGIYKGDLSAIERALNKLKVICEAEGKTLSTSRFGCDTNLRWELSPAQEHFKIGTYNTVKPIYDKVFKDFEVEVYNV